MNIFAGVRKRRDVEEMDTLFRAALAEKIMIVSVEIGLAGGQVLQEVFGFDDRQITQWMDATLDRAKANREAMIESAINDGK